MGRTEEYERQDHIEYVHITGSMWEGSDVNPRYLLLTQGDAGDGADAVDPEPESEGDDEHAPPRDPDFNTPGEPEDDDDHF